MQWTKYENSRISYKLRFRNSKLLWNSIRTNIHWTRYVANTLRSLNVQQSDGESICGKCRCTAGSWGSSGRRSWQSPWSMGCSSSNICTQIDKSQHKYYFIRGRVKTLKKLGRWENFKELFCPSNFWKFVHTGCYRINNVNAKYLVQHLEVLSVREISSR